MSKAVCFVLNRRFYGALDNGLTFYWLRLLHVSELSSVIARAIRLVYLPSALGADCASWDRVHLERQESRREFEEWMNPSAGSVTSSAIPKRIQINIPLEYPVSSDNGKTLAWMLETFGEKTCDLIVQAVQLVYLPSALTAFQEHRGRVDFEVRRSRMLFSDKRASDELPTTRELLPFSTNGKPREVTVLSAVTPTCEEVEDFDESEPSHKPIHSDDFPDLDLDAIYNED
jgi:hypothetical protein